MKKQLVAAAASLALLVAVAPANALTLGFESITNNSSTNAGAGESQLSVEVTAGANGQVDFTFRNIGTAQSTISEIYFDDGTLLGIASITDSDGAENGVSYEAIGSAVDPANLPGGNTISPVFETTAGFASEPNNPQPKKGVNNTVAGSEWVMISFTLKNGGTFETVTSELESGELRIGVHVINFANGGSESFVNGPSQNVPEPSTLLLLGSGILGLGIIRRRRA